MKIDSFSAELGPSSTLFDLVSGYDGVPLVLLRLGGVDNGLLRPVVDQAVDQEARRGDRALKSMGPQISPTSRKFNASKLN